MELNITKKEISIKLVYYGPPLSGKTTNLQALHYFLKDSVASDLVTLNTKDDRTLFFDLLPIEYLGKNNFKLKLQVFTVPGQIIHTSTRKMILKSADGVVFVADSQVDQLKNNNSSYRDLLSNLRFHNLENIPIVIQFNKRDLPDIISDQEIIKFSERQKDALIIKASAIEGDGVLETFSELLKLTYDSLDSTYKFNENFGINKTDLLKDIFRNFKNE